MTIVPLLEKISRFVLNPLITLAFAIAFGFGARDAAEKIFADWVDALKKK